MKKRKLLCLSCLLGMMLLLTGCGMGKILNLFLVRNDQGPDMDAVMESLMAEQAESAGIYWEISVPEEGYEVSLRDGKEEGSLEAVVQREEKEWVAATFLKSSADYQTPEDISAEPFQNILGHNGFCIYERHPLGSSYYYYEIFYYALEEEPIELASYWGDKDQNVWQKDLDGDGIAELICNVQWMADGARDTIIYHFDGEKILQGYGSDLLLEEFDNYGTGSIGSEYLPEQNKIRIWYWKDDIEDFLEKECEIDLEKLEMYEYSG